MPDTLQDIREETSLGRHRRTGLEIPPSWTVPHLALRIRDYFDFWKRSPGAGLNSKAGFWPAYLHTAADINGYINRDGVPQDVLDLGDPMAEHIRARNRRTVPLDGYEVLIRDRVQDYLIDFRSSDATSHELIVFDGRMAADGYGLRDRAREWGGMPKSTYEDARKKALTACCAYLNQRGKPVL